MQVTAVNPSTAVPAGEVEKQDRRDVHVVPNGDRWTIKLERHAMQLPNFQTQAEALGYGMQIARELAVSLVLHAANGRIREVWSYDR